MEVYKKTSRGKEVTDIQMRLLKLGLEVGENGADGVFGEETERAVEKFQRTRKIKADGKVGGQTWKELVEATYVLGERLLYLKTPFFHGDDVKKLQVRLNTLGFSVGFEDGIFGPQTEKATRDFQKNTGVTADGIVGPSTLKAMDNLRKIFEAEDKTEFPREMAKEHSLVTTFEGKRILVGFDNFDGLKEKKNKLSEADKVCRDLAARLGNLFELLGARAIYSWRAKETFLSKGSRVDLAILFSLGSSSNAAKQGSTTCYSASQKKDLKESKKLASFIQRQLVASLLRKDGGVSAKEFLLPELLEKAVVCVEPAYISNPEEKSLLLSEIFRQKIAVAAFDGVKNFLES